MAGALSDSFAHGRLTREELGERAGRVWASRTYAELAAILADIPTELTRARRKRAPWRATKRALWFEYATFLPGILAVILLPGGPHTTAWTLVILASVLYLLFWILGAVLVITPRRAQPSVPPPPPASWYLHQQATGILKAARAQGRLTEEEFSERAAQEPAAKSIAELDALTADLPSGLTDRLPKARDAWTGAGVSAGAAGVLGALMLAGPDNMGAFMLGLLSAGIVLTAPPVTAGLIADARHQRRIRGQLRMGLE